MEELKINYEEEIKLLQLFQSSFFYGIEFDKEKYQENSKDKFIKKYILKKIAEKIEVVCKETIYKKWIEKTLEIKINKSEKEYEIYKIVINLERINLICEKYDENKKIVYSKQYGINGHVIYKYEDLENNYIVHHNVNNMFFYLENFSDNLYSNIFKMENESFKYISKLPYKFIYDSIVYCNALNENDLNKIVEKEKTKRKMTNSLELKVDNDEEKDVKKHIELIKMVYDNTKNLYDDMIKSILSLVSIDEIMKKGTGIIEELENVQNASKNKSMLEILKTQKLELMEIKKSTDEIIDKLQKILLN